MTRKERTIKSSAESRISSWKCCTALHNTSGGSLVELALVVPVFITLLLGAVMFARLAYAGIEVSNAARAGVAYGSQSSLTALDLTGMQTAATNDGGNITGLSATATQFWSCSNAPSTQFTSAPTCIGTGNHVLNYVQVTTSAAVPLVIHVPGLPATYTLHGLAIMRVL